MRIPEIVEEPDILEVTQQLASLTRRNLEDWGIDERGIYSMLEGKIPEQKLPVIEDLSEEEKNRIRQVVTEWGKDIREKIEALRESGNLSIENHGKKYEREFRLSHALREAVELFKTLFNEGCNMLLNVLDNFVPNIIKNTEINRKEVKIAMAEGAMMLVFGLRELISILAAFHREAPWEKIYEDLKEGEKVAIKNITYSIYREVEKAISDQIKAIGETTNRHAQQLEEWDDRGESEVTPENERA